MEAFVFCPLCQADNPRDRLYCRLCGASLEGVEPSGPLELEPGSPAPRPTIQCLRCAVPLRFEGYQLLRRQNLEPKDGLFAGELRIELFACPRCGHFEMFKPEVGEPRRWSTES